MAKNNSPVNYPFQTKAQIKAELDESFEARCDAIVTLYRLQTEDEQDAKTTKYSNKRGFMSSHAVNGTRVAEKLIAEETVDTLEFEKLFDDLPPKPGRFAGIPRVIVPGTDGGTSTGPTAPAPNPSPQPA